MPLAFTRQKYFFPTTKFEPKAYEDVGSVIVALMLVDVNVLTVDTWIVYPVAPSTSCQLKVGLI